MINLMEVENKEDYINLVKKISALNTDVSDIIGVLTVFIYSKDIFKSNKDLPEFISSVLGVKYKDYVFKVRTTLVSKCSRFIYLSSKEELDLIRKNFIRHFIFDTPKERKVSSKRNENDKLGKWLEG